MVYVILAALQQVGSRLTALSFLVAIPVCLAWVWRHTRPSLGVAGRNVHPTALSALRVCAWGTGLWLAARLGPAGRPGFDLAANVGLGSALVAAQLALARIPHREGLIEPPRSARSLDAAAVCALLWGIATALPAARTLWPDQSLLLEPLATSYATSVASIASMVALIFVALRLRVTRFLELGVLDRASAAIALSLTAFGIAVPAAAANLAAPDRALPFGALLAALACAWTATTQQSRTLSSSLRGALVVLLLGAPVALATGALAQNAPAHAGLIALAGCGAALLVGLLARALARPLNSEQARWLHGLHQASRACLEPEPNAAIVAALEALQGLERALRTRPELWRVDPPDVLSVDVAGYLHTERGTAPEELYTLARAEPERTLRRDVLEALQVRRPEVRPVLGWMEARDAFAVTLVCDDQAPLGLLLLPKGLRTGPLTLEEARAARLLCDRLSAVLSMSSSIAGSRARETHAIQRATELAQETARLEAIIQAHARPRDLLVDTLAASVRVATYSARARATLESLEKLGAANADVTLEVPVGIDALGFAAVVHLGSPRRAGPFVVVDGTLAGAHAAAFFGADPDAALERARGGTLVVHHVAALPIEAQDMLAVALSRRLPSSDAEASPFALVSSVPQPPQALLDERHLSRALAQLLSAHVVQLPPLSERAEDLRALVLDRLCKSGVRFAGHTLGIEPQAMSALVDYEWPGNVRELEGVVERAAHVAQGERVRVSDLVAVGFSGTLPSAPSVMPLPRARSVEKGEKSVDGGESDMGERSVVRRRRRR